MWINRLLTQTPNSLAKKLVKAWLLGLPTFYFSVHYKISQGFYGNKDNIAKEKIYLPFAIKEIDYPGTW